MSTTKRPPPADIRPLVWNDDRQGEFDKMESRSVDLEEELGKIWALVGELSEQLSNNRALVVQLKSRSDNVKGQAAHAGAGFPLRRFNLDISDETFTSELEAFASHLVLENQQLQNESKQLNSLLKEYETTLELVMGKFRGVAHASQQHDLSLHSYYTSLLQSLQTAHSTAQLHDDTSLSLLLTRLSTLLRSALRSVGGEDIDLDLPGLLRYQPPLSPISSSPTSSSSGGARSMVPRAPSRPAHFPGFLPGMQGGYSGTEGQPDWALEREMEIVRLEDENKALREMLAISTELPAVPEEVKLDEEEEEVVSPPLVGGSRKSSLTVQELEEGAVMEQASGGPVSIWSGDHSGQGTADGGGGGGGGRDGVLSITSMEVEGEATAAGVGHTLGPGTGLGGGAGVLGERRSAVGILGFEADGPPPEQAIVDDADGDGDGDGEPAVDEESSGDGRGQSEEEQQDTAA